MVTAVACSSVPPTLDSFPCWCKISVFLIHAGLFLVLDMAFALQLCSGPSGRDVRRLFLYIRPPPILAARYAIQG